ncbi:hypothetical protein [Rarobacter incanus]|uniref:Uncharacterized protein n=1 Tax=Rarobacter incanus TaxID=153494 RepID=A0A542SP92_9MICO|nr:hypothetical protein [Rarobacter incanus]TQK76441.1 hypothetical protein FB389_1113 [Rarobacter incanus]
MRLDAGIRLQDVIANAGLDTLAALAEWAPAWLDTQHHATPSGLTAGKPAPTSYAHLHHLIGDRVAELLGDIARTAHDAATDAQAVTAYAESILDYLQTTIDGQPATATATGLSVTLTAHYAEQAARGRTTNEDDAA